MAFNARCLYVSDLPLARRIESPVSRILIKVINYDGNFIDRDRVDSNNKNI